MRARTYRVGNSRKVRHALDGKAAGHVLLILDHFRHAEHVDNRVDGLDRGRVFVAVDVVLHASVEAEELEGRLDEGSTPVAGKSCPLANERSA